MLVVCVVVLVARVSEVVYAACPILVAMDVIWPGLVLANLGVWGAVAGTCFSDESRFLGKTVFSSSAILSRGPVLESGVGRDACSDLGAGARTAFMDSFPAVNEPGTSCGVLTDPGLSLANATVL